MTGDRFAVTGDRFAVTAPRSSRVAGLQGSRVRRDWGQIRRDCVALLQGGVACGSTRSGFFYFSESRKGDRSEKSKSEKQLFEKVNSKSEK